MTLPESSAAPLADGPSLQPLRWPVAAFVCGRCEDRKGAPKSLDAKRIGKKLREALREAGLRSRVMTTTCMGLCPRGAVVVALTTSDRPPVLVELRKKRDAGSVVARLAVPGRPNESLEEPLP